MKQPHSSSGNHLLEVLRLLEQIVASFTDAYSRPREQIAFYQRYKELKKTHEARLVGRFIVIEGKKRVAAPDHEKQLALLATKRAPQLKTTQA